MDLVYLGLALACFALTWGLARLIHILSGGPVR